MSWYQIASTVVGLAGLLLSMYVLVWRDPQLRRREDEERQILQARLIFGRFVPDDTAPYVELLNLSTSAIINVSVGLMRAQGAEGAPMVDVPLRGGISTLDLIEPRQGPRPRLHAPSGISGPTAVEIRFTDAAGLVWKRRNLDQPLRVM